MGFVIISIGVLAFFNTFALTYNNYIMKNLQAVQPISVDNIKAKIYEFRGQKVMLDRDLAALYQVETKRLNEAVKRKRMRFPSDFMFQTNDEEIQNWKSQFATSNSIKMGAREKAIRLYYFCNVTNTTK